MDNKIDLVSLYINDREQFMRNFAKESTVANNVIKKTNGSKNNAKIVTNEKGEPTGVKRITNKKQNQQVQQPKQQQTTVKKVSNKNSLQNMLKEGDKNLKVQANANTQKLATAFTKGSNLLKNSGKVAGVALNYGKNAIKDKINSARNAIGGAKDKVVNGVKNIFTRGAFSRDRMQNRISGKNAGAKDVKMTNAYNTAQKNLEAKKSNLGKTQNQRGFWDTMKDAVTAGTQDNNKAFKHIVNSQNNIARNNANIRTKQRDIENKMAQNNRTLKSNARQFEKGNYKAENSRWGFKNFSTEYLDMFNFSMTDPVFTIESNLITAWNADGSLQQMFSDYYEFEEYVITNFSDMDYVNDYLAKFEPVLNFVANATHFSNNTLFGLDENTIEVLYNFSDINIENDGSSNYIDWELQGKLRKQQELFSFTGKVSGVVEGAVNAVKKVGNTLSKTNNFLTNNFSPEAQSDPNYEQRDFSSYTELTNNITKGVGPGKFGYGLGGKEDQGLHFTEKTKENIKNQNTTLGSYSDIAEEFFSDLNVKNTEKNYSKIINFFNEGNNK